jgi:hypothetical protein
MRRHLTYSNVAATLALIFSMTAGAIASTHYLITNIHQVKPSVLAQLRGRSGPAGKEGIQGKLGIQGLVGPAGVPGEKGAPGIGINGARGPTGPAGGGSGEAGPTGPRGPAGTKGETGAIGPEGKVGPTGPGGSGTGGGGVTGPTGPTGTGGGGGGREVEAAGALSAFLATGKSESGTWSATISEPSGAPQTQADGVISLPIPLKTEAGKEYKLVYRSEAVSSTPTPPCVGSLNEPNAEAGALCVYRGGDKGMKESEDKNAKFVKWADALGNYYANEALTAAKSGRTGMLVLFRTNEFVETETPTTISAAALLVASGSWSVRAL